MKRLEGKMSYVEGTGHRRNNFIGVAESGCGGPSHGAKVRYIFKSQFQSISNLADL